MLYLELFECSTNQNTLGCALLDTKLEFILLLLVCEPIAWHSTIRRQFVWRLLQLPICSKAGTMAGHLLRDNEGRVMSDYHGKLIMLPKPVTIKQEKPDAMNQTPPSAVTPMTTHGHVPMDTPSPQILTQTHDVCYDRDGRAMMACNGQLFYLVKPPFKNEQEVHPLYV